LSFGAHAAAVYILDDDLRGEHVMSESSQDTCPRCGVGHLRAWRELSEEEREVVRRLPASAEQTIDERIARHRWCARCWHEAPDTPRPA